MIRGISKKEIRAALNYSNRMTFNRHLKQSGLDQQLPPYFFTKSTFFGKESEEIKEIFGI